MVAGAIAGSRYGRDMAEAERRIRDFAPRYVDTSFGRLEYVELGEATQPPVLLVHGVGGGIDQGAIMANHWPSGYRVIAPSRVGYLGSELAQGASPENQAEAFCELLEGLRIRKAVVVAASAGSVSSLRLALKHADRVAGLALCGAMLPASAERGAGNPVLDTVLGSRPLLARLLGWNVPMWLVSKSRAAVLTLLGVQSLSLFHPLTSGV